MIFLITCLYAGILGLLLVALSFKVVRMRVSKKIFFGSDGDNELSLASRAHGNLTEYMPSFLILLAVLESTNVVYWILHSLGILFVLARLSHAYSVLKYNPENPAIIIFRGFGIFMTLIVITLASILAIYCWAMR